MRVHEEEMNSPLFDDVNNLKPVIQKGASDSAALDNVFELLNISGQPAPLAKLMLVPDAWSKKNKTLPKSHQQLFNCSKTLSSAAESETPFCITGFKFSTLSKRGLLISCS